MSVETLLGERSLVVCVGPGGVGKTTIAAAMGLEAARMGRNTLVLTIDPAKRLADALGLTGLDDAVQEIDTAALVEAGTPVPGKLYAAMLDTGASFDALMGRVAPTPEARERILNNRVYQAMAGTLARSHAYVAMERLYEVMNGGQYDLVILDTPPTRNALDILDAPGRLVSFLEESVVKWFVRREQRGIRARILNTGSAAATKLLGVLAGQEFLDEIISFFESFYDLREGFRERADEVRALLRRPGSAFVVISSGDPGSIEDAWALAEGILERGVSIDVAVFNRSYEPLRAGDPLAIITRVEPRDAEQVLTEVWPDAARREQVLALLDGVARARIQAAAANSRALDAVERLMARLPAGCRRVQVARLEGDVRDLGGLAEISPFLRVDRGG